MCVFSRKSCIRWATFCRHRDSSYLPKFYAPWNVRRFRQDLGLLSTTQSDLSFCSHFALYCGHMKNRCLKYFPPFILIIGIYRLTSARIAIQAFDLKSYNFSRRGFDFRISYFHVLSFVFLFRNQCNSKMLIEYQSWPSLI